MTENQQIINLETKITQIQQIINNYKSELANYENTLLALAQQLSQIKNQTNKTNMNKNNKISPLDSKQIK
jgi:chromosome segregation ATPase